LGCPPRLNLSYSIGSPCRGSSAQIGTVPQLAQRQPGGGGRRARFEVDPKIGGGGGCCARLEVDPTPRNAGTKKRGRLPPVSQLSVYPSNHSPAFRVLGSRQCC
jgi:hypothetical protein